MAGERCHRLFQRLFIRREKTRRVHRGDNFHLRATILVRWRLQRRGSGAGKADAERRSLLCFAFCKNSFAIVGTFRIGKVLYHSRGTEFLFGRDVSGLYQDDRDFARTRPAQSGLWHP